MKRLAKIPVHHPKLALAWLVSSLLSLACIAPLVYIWPSLSPFSFFEFWHIKGSLWEAIWGAWPIYVFGIAISVWALLPFNNHDDEPEDILFGGFLLSLWAGVVEEICFRWLIFMGAIVVFPLLDFLLLGFVGLHIIQWIYELVAYVANFFTLGALSDYLLGGFGWAVAAAIIMANGEFRNGHAYQGFWGLVINWFMGMYFFWVMFTYGLIAAIIVHFLYDLIIFTTVAIDALIEKKMIPIKVRARRRR